jgi:hypothetical protein
MMNLFLGFAAFSNVLGSLAHLLRMLLFVYEEHRQAEDAITTKRVTEFIQQRAWLIEAFMYQKGKTAKLPSQCVIGWPFCAIVQTISKQPYSDEVERVITISFPRWWKAPWDRPYLEATTTTKRRTTPAAQEDDMASDCAHCDVSDDDDSTRLLSPLSASSVSMDSDVNSDCNSITVEYLMKMTDYIGTHYTEKKRRLVLRTPHDHSTYRFARRFIMDNIADMKVGDLWNYRMVLFGAPGTGKSTIAKVLAHELDGYLVHVDPSVPGSQMSEIYSYASEKPVIILVEEADQLLRRIHAAPLNQIESKTVRRVHDKGSWNSWMDEIKDMDNIILILTMNSTPAHLDATGQKCVGDLDVDDSFLRAGRFLKFYNIARAKINSAQLISTQPNSTQHNLTQHNSTTTLSPLHFTYKHCTPLMVEDDE